MQALRPYAKPYTTPMDRLGRGLMRYAGASTELRHYLHLDKYFNDNLAEWDVSSVTDMRDMFRKSAFNGDISEWDVSSVTDMSGMFDSAAFNGDISEWDVSSVTNMSEGLVHKSATSAGVVCVLPLSLPCAVTVNYAVW